MSPRPRSAVGDAAEREAAIGERSLNVLIDAGAGTGKTATLVERLIALVAPRDDRAVPMRLDRIAAVTFTRRAAGELRLRIRERLLAELGGAGVSEARATRLRNALSALDTAHVGTIHSFADRLLRLHPVEAELSPSYTIAEDAELLVRETFEALLTGAESGTLGATLAGTPAAARAAEAERTVLDALRAGLRAESEEREFFTLCGLDGLVEAFIRHRDVPPRDPRDRPFDAAAFRKCSAELRKLVAGVHGTSSGARWLAGLGQLLDRLEGEADPIVLYAALQPALHSIGNPTKGETFENDPLAWHAWKLLKHGASKDVTRNAPLREDLLAPMKRWLATRLVRLYPVVLALYEKVKARRQEVDSIDLLLVLRDLCARDKRVRAHYQSLFDHLFVDEFQDTDPLQAEVLLFLCEKHPVAARAADVELADGKLTLVGDPKQSIYRFRRADIAMYESVRAKVAGGRHRAVQLSANFRSTPPLIEWFNDRFAALLGAPPKKGQPAFSVETGEVAYQPLRAGRTDGQSVSIHVVPFQPDGDKANVGEYRALEAEVLARYLRWLVERSDLEIKDPVTQRRRPVTYADVAVLALETTNLGLLFPELDAMGVPHAARGGTLFLRDPLHRQFLLGLRAIADREDGVAQAALLRPPFFDLDVGELLSSGERAEAARALVRDLRARRLARPPGATARDLLERTAFGRHVALGPNGSQRLERLRELCLALEQLAASDGLDFDGATARLRDWVLSPVQLDAPHPVGDDAVQIMTVHQAKGLEFPVVVLWDGRAGMAGRTDTGPWHVARDGKSWQLAVDRFDWEEPAGAALTETEKKYRDAERKRLVYVAATRARDLVVVPKAGEPGAKHVAGMLLAGSHGPMALELQTYRAGKGAAWARSIRLPARKSFATDAGLEGRVAAGWVAAATEAARPRFRPSGVAAAAHRQIAASLGDAPPRREPRRGRHGPMFGDAVHRAIGAVLRTPGLSVDVAVGRAAAVTGLMEHLDVARADVERALDALRREVLTMTAGSAVRVEYPVAGGASSGDLLVGYIDLLVQTATGLVVIDFKTDRAPDGAVERTYPEYVQQLATYVNLLRQGGLASSGPVRAGLLFTEGGNLCWIQRGAERACSS